MAGVAGVVTGLVDVAWVIWLPAGLAAAVFTGATGLGVTATGLGVTLVGTVEATAGSTAAAVGVTGTAACLSAGK